MGLATRPTKIPKEAESGLLKCFGKRYAEADSVFLQSEQQQRGIGLVAPGIQKMSDHLLGQRKSKGPGRTRGNPARALIEVAVLSVLQDQEPMHIEQLVRALPAYTWRQVFTAVDVLRKDAVLTVTQPDPLSYRIGLSRAGHC